MRRPSTSMSRRSVSAALAGVLSAAAVGTVAVLGSGGGAEAANTKDYKITGAWQVTVTPPANGPLVPFETTQVFGKAHEISEANSSAGFHSGGAGAWTKTGPSTYKTVLQVYQFTPEGDYAGKLVIHEDITMTSASAYRTVSTATIVSPAGDQVAQFPVTARAKRLTP